MYRFEKAGIIPAKDRAKFVVSEPIQQPSHKEKQTETEKTETGEEIQTSEEERKPTKDVQTSLIKTSWPVVARSLSVL